MREQLEVVAADLEHIDELWTEGGLRHRYDAYRAHAEPRTALAAALVETAVDLQGLGRRVPGAVELLLADLCLARASRLLADTREQRLQVAFARSIELLSAAAAAEQPMPPVRGLLLAAIGGS